MNKEQMEVLEDLLAAVKALEAFKFKCYSFMNAPEVNVETYRDFILKNAPCNYGMQNRFENLIKQLHNS